MIHFILRKGVEDFQMSGYEIFLLVAGCIVTVGSVLTSLCVIFGFVAKPAKKYKEKQEQELKNLIVSVLKENLPELLKQHDIDLRNQYKADRDRYLLEIKNSVLSDTQNELAQIKILGVQYEALVISAKDILREKIMKIYNANKDTKRMHLIEKERLDQYYKDYKALKGNSYIDKYYNRMKKWEIIDDDSDMEDEIV